MSAGITLELFQTAHFERLNAVKFRMVYLGLERSVTINAIQPILNRTTDTHYE